MPAADGQKISSKGISKRSNARSGARATQRQRNKASKNQTNSAFRSKQSRRPRQTQATLPSEDIFGSPSEGFRSRGYQKIAEAARAFNFDFRGKTVLDIGSSTGGFTQYALDHGAKKVIAIEKGTNQMAKPLRFDPRVELHEKTDIFSFRLREGVADNVFFKGISRFSRSETYIPDDAEKAARRADFPERPAYDVEGEKVRPEKDMSDRTPSPDTIVADVSFLSLTKVLKYAKIHLACSNTDFLVMLKPQFEARPADLVGGVVKNHKIRRDIIKNFEQWLRQNGFIIIKKRDNDLKGKTGNRERFYWLKNASVNEKTPSGF